MLKVELNTHEIPEIFENLKCIIGEEHWLKRAKLITEEIKGAPYLKEFLLKENSIIFSLLQYSALSVKHGAIPLHETENRNLYPAISFVAQALSIIEHVSHSEKKKLIRRIHGAFKNPDDMRAIRLEILAATHFVVNGYSISWPEMDKTGTFDLLVNDICDNGLEIECKSISPDKGMKIHQREILEFYNLIGNEIKDIALNLKIGLSIVLTIPGRLPKKSSDRKILASKVSDQILSAQCQTEDNDNDICITEFDFSIITNADHNKTKTINQITKTQNRAVMYIPNQYGGGVLFVLQSSQSNTVLKSIFDTLSKSANSQVTKTRPAMFFVGLHDIEKNGLNEIAKKDSDSQQPPTALTIGVSKFFNNKNFEHIVGVSFLDEGEHVPQQNGNVETNGTTYSFKKEKSAFWHEELCELFTP